MERKKQSLDDLLASHLKTRDELAFSFQPALQAETEKHIAKLEQREKEVEATKEKLFAEKNTSLESAASDLDHRMIEEKYLQQVRDLEDQLEQEKIKVALSFFLEASKMVDSVWYFRR